MSRRNRITKMLFRVSLMELMQKKPFEKVTIKGVCEQADLNRTTFYLHYRDVETLLEDTVNDYVDNVVEALRDEEKPLVKCLNYVKKNNTTSETLLCGMGGEELRRDVLNRVIAAIQDLLPVVGTKRFNDYFYTFLVEGSAYTVARWIKSDFDIPTDELAAILGNYINKLIAE